MVRLIHIGLFICLFSLPALAKEPLEITADKTLEWQRDQQKIVARGNVIAKQGDAKIRSAILTAKYKEGQKENKFIPQSLRAENNVIITTQDGKVYGDIAIYDIGSETATLTGKDLKLISDDLTLTANDKFKYDINGGTLSALGGAKLLQVTDKGKNTIEAETLSARFLDSDDSSRNRELEKMEANGNVVITTPTEIIRGDKGIYNKMKNIAELTGNVKVIRGPNTLEGEIATVDLNTNISTLSGGTQDNPGRVKGVFYPQ